VIPKDARANRTDVTRPSPRHTRHVLVRHASGLRVAVAPMPHVRSAAVGVWIAAGSRQETAGLEGAAHLWEHMAFKGTGRRSALDIARSLDRLGGLSNAFTGREDTCFHARVVASGLPEAFDILSDLVLHPLLDPAELALEKGVIQQEIAAVDETPEESAFETFWQSLWSDPAVAHPILGTADSVGNLSREALRGWRAAHYTADRIIVAAAGAVDPDAFCAAAQQAFAGLGGSAPSLPLPSPRFRPCGLAVERDVEQSHVLLAYPAASLADPGRYAWSCLSALLGGQMSSRLFQEVREKRGLAYSISSHPQALTDCGILEIYAAASPERTGELLRVVRREITAVAEGGVTAEELAHAKEHLTGLLFLGDESTEERMLRMARNVALHGRHVPVEEAAAMIDAVTLDEVRDAAATLGDPGGAALLVLAPEVDAAWAGTFDKEFATP